MKIGHAVYNESIGKNTPKINMSKMYILLYGLILKRITYTCVIWIRQKK